MVEQLICNQLVGGSTPSSSTNRVNPIRTLGCLVPKISFQRYGLSGLTAEQRFVQSSYRVQEYRRVNKLVPFHCGELAEWSNAAVLKTVDLRKVLGFESLTLRQYPEEGAKMNREQELLVESNMNLVPYTWQKHRSSFPIGDKEDYFGEGYMGLCKAALTWDPSRGMFSTYAVYCILNAMRKYLRSQNKVSHHEIMESGMYTVDSDGDEVSLFEFIPAPDLSPEFDDYDYEVLVAVEPNLKGREVQAYPFILRGEKQAKAAAELGISQAYYSRIRKQVINKLRSVYGKSFAPGAPQRSEFETFEEYREAYRKCKHITE